MGAEKRRIGWLGLLAVGLVLSAGAGAWAAAPRSGSWIPIAKGQTGKFEWALQIHRPGMAQRRRVARTAGLCLSVSALWRVGPYDYRRTRSQQCATASTRLTAAGAPMIASAGQPSDRRQPRFTAAGMLFAPAVRRVRITLSGGTQLTLHPKRFSSGQAQGPGLSGLRYSALVIHGAWCSERLVTLGANGKRLWDSGTDPYSCAPGS